MCFPRRTIREDSNILPTPPSSPQAHLNKAGKSGSTEPLVESKPIYLPETVPNEMKTEQVQNRLVPVIKNLFDDETLKKTGGSSDLLAVKLAQKNKLDEAKDLQEQTCEDDANFYNLRKDILAIVDKTNPKKEEDTVYSKRKMKGKEPAKQKIVGKMTYTRDKRQSKTKEEKSKSLEKLSTTEYDMENDVNEKNYMYNLKEIDYCTHDMMRCIEEDNLYKNINDDSKLPEKVEPYGDLTQLAKRRYTSCKVLRRNTLLSTMLSMPSGDEAEAAATATAKHMSQHCAIRFLPVTTLIQHCEEQREDRTGIDLSDIIRTGTAIASLPPKTAEPLRHGEGESSRKRGGEKKKKEKDKMVEMTCESEKKTAEEM